MNCLKHSIRQVATTILHPQQLNAAELAIPQSSSPLSRPDSRPSSRNDSRTDSKPGLSSLSSTTTTHTPSKAKSDAEETFEIQMSLKTLCGITQDTLTCDGKLKIHNKIIKDIVKVSE